MNYNSFFSGFVKFIIIGKYLGRPILLIQKFIVVVDWFDFLFQFSLSL